MKKLLVLIALAVAGCARVQEGGSRVGAIEESISVGGGYYVNVIRLKDGTRCAMSGSSEGGLSCDWARNDLRRGVE